MKKIVSILLTALLLSTVIAPLSTPETANAASYIRVAPEPKGKWKLEQIKKYKTPNYTTAKNFGVGAASYLTGKFKGLGAGVLASGLLNVFASKIKSKSVYITAHCYSKENAYVRLTKVTYSIYSDSKRKKKIKTISSTNKFIKKYKLVSKPKKK